MSSTRIMHTWQCVQIGCMGVFSQLLEHSCCCAMLCYAMCTGPEDPRLIVWPGKGLYMMFGSKPWPKDVNGVLPAQTACEGPWAFQPWLIQLQSYAPTPDPTDPWAQGIIRLQYLSGAELAPGDLLKEKNWNPFIYKGKLLFSQVWLCCVGALLLVWGGRRPHLLARIAFVKQLCWMNALAAACDESLLATCSVLHVMLTCCVCLLSGQAVLCVVASLHLTHTPHSPTNNSNLTLTW